MKICSRCGIEQPLNNFAKNKARRDGVSTYCSPCQLEYQRLRYAEPLVYKRRQMSREIYKERRKGSSRKWYLKSKYGLTEEQYALMFDKYNGSCWICGIKPKYSLHVDHDHNCCSGEKSCGKCVRGLLCYSCNIILGHSKDNVEILKNSVKYINGLR